MKWHPKDQKKRTTLTLTWMDDIEDMTKQKRLTEEVWEDRNNWRLIIL